MAMASPEVVLPEEEEGAAGKNDVCEGRLTRQRAVRPDVAELLQRGPPRPRRPETRTTKATEAERARYGCAFEEEEEAGGGKFAPPRLVWAKVKGHPWWPAQVFDPADASELALGERRPRGSTLVACFWDKTFAWVPRPGSSSSAPALLRPFRAGFPRLAAVHSRVHVRGRTGAATMTFLGSAVDAALAEVARRVDAGLSCFCAGCAGCAMKQAVENAGVREGALGAVADAAFARDALRGDAFVDYLSALAVAPLAGADKLDLTVAKAQLTAFTRWRGTRGLPAYTAVYGIDDLADGGATKANRRAANAAKTKRRRASARDRDACVARWKMSRRSISRARDDDDDDAMVLDGFEPMPQPLSHQMSTKMGKLMSRAARQMSRSSAAANRRARCNDHDDDQVNSDLMMMARCTSTMPTGTAAHTMTAPSVKLRNGGLKDEPPVAGLVLNFTGPGVVPSMTDLVKMFSQFGPIVEIRIENSAAVVVVFKRSADAETAFSGTAKIGALSANLISFRLTYSLLSGATPIGSPKTPVSTDEEDRLQDVQ